jgi:sulfatase maturation enzyme AslB (radical SAM superfamily)
MCNSSYSSIWEKEINKFPELKKFQTLHESNNVSSKILQNFDLIKDNVKKISLTGGEPLLIKDHLKLLELLIENNKTDVEITITTNLTTLNPNWQDKITKFKTVHWTVSIDAIGQIGEYIRWPNYSWDVIDRNLDWLFKYGHSIAINATLTTYSLLDIDKLIDYYIDKRKNTSHPFDLWFSVAEHPAALSIYHMPQSFKEVVLKKLDYSINLLDKIAGHENSCNTLQGVVDGLKKPDCSLNNDFYIYTTMLDKQRNQDFFETFKGII